MGEKWNYFMYLVWLSYLITSSILMFSRGFLLTRTAQENTSSCIHFEDVICTPQIAIKRDKNDHVIKCSDHDKMQFLLKDINATANVCLPRRSRVVLIVIDAFKYEFADYNGSITKPHYFQNKVPIIKDLLQNSPEHARLFKFIADPPTTTLQRLKGLTTGSLPTFIDAGSNFATPEINEDNIIDQVVKHGGKAVLLGDDTWEGLYPQRWLRKLALHSFNTWDLDTVDNAINSKIMGELASEDWSLLVAHYLGVDHCGHRYGPFHLEMERKLGEMNQMIEKVVAALDNDTTLFVIGDHGMTYTGDHGGESEDEVTATMFVYSNAQLMSVPAPLNDSTVRQVDLVPTLASILGVPIPHSSLGSLIVNALPLRTDMHIADWKFALMNLWANVKQVASYIQLYAENSNEFTQEELEDIQTKFKLLSLRVKDIYTAKAFVSIASDAKAFISEVRTMCQEVWIQFDSYSMSRGLLLILLTIFFNYLIIDGIPPERLPHIFKSSFLWCAYGLMAFMVAVSIICHTMRIVDNLEVTILFSTGMVSVFMLGALVIQNWEHIAQKWHDLAKRNDWINRAARTTLAMSAGALLSNSYIIEEGTSSAFLFMSLLFLVAFSAKQPKYVLPLFIGVAIIMTLSRNYRICREEQGICYFNAELPNITSHNLAMALISLALLVTVTKLWLRSCGNLTAPGTMLLRYAPPVTAVCIGSHWVTSWGPYRSITRSDNLALISYTIIGLVVINVIIKPLMVYLVPKENETVSVSSNKDIVPQLFNHLKHTFSNKSNVNSNESSQELPIVCGLGSVYSAVFVTLSVCMTLLVAMLLSLNYAPSAVYMYATGTLTLAIISIARYQNSSTILQVFTVDAAGTQLWLLVSLYYFYGTGHHPALNAVRWGAAFVGTGGEFAHNSIPGALIILNTFGSHIIFGLCIPLLVIAPFTLYAIWGQTHKVDLRRGELIVYERERHLFSALFHVSAKYILFYSIRMFVCMLAATIHCRHLMVWKIFAPKFIFEGVGLMITMAVVSLSYLLVIRIHTSLDRYLLQITKSR